jgi:hypothetical protein
MPGSSSSNTGNARWDNGTISACNNTYNLICFVNP